MRRIWHFVKNDTSMVHIAIHDQTGKAVVPYQLLPSALDISMAGWVGCSYELVIVQGGGIYRTSFAVCRSALAVRRR
ncbi:MAG: hypothetical protein JST90_10680 [Bacteroidetes bacterium]|nr:hypothetical protein [Bacteroidota bacterium]